LTSDAAVQTFSDLPETCSQTLTLLARFIDRNDHSVLLKNAHTEGNESLNTGASAGLLLQTLSTLNLSSAKTLLVLISKIDSLLQAIISLLRIYR